MTPDERALVDRVAELLSMMGDKWKPAIIFCLVFYGPMRFNELKKAIGGVTQKMLTQRLRALERDGIVKRRYFEEIPPRVEYEITKLGQSIHPLYAAVCDWGSVNMKAVSQANSRFDRSTRQQTNVSS